nr:MAG TPA: hypothetical protein [Caudoviricetes sp.]
MTWRFTTPPRITITWSGPFWNHQLFLLPLQHK